MGENVRFFLRLKKGKNGRKFLWRHWTKMPKHYLVQVINVWIVLISKKYKNVSQWYQKSTGMEIFRHFLYSVNKKSKILKKFWQFPPLIVGSNWTLDHVIHAGHVRERDFVPASTDKVGPVDDILTSCQLDRFQKYREHMNRIHLKILSNEIQRQHWQYHQNLSVQNLHFGREKRSRLTLFEFYIDQSYSGRSRQAWDGP